MMDSNPRFKTLYEFDYHFLVPKLTCTEVWPLKDLVRASGQVIFDVGASHGAWTKAWLDTFGPAVEQIHLFEPLPGNAAQIRDKLKIGFFDEHMAGLSNRLVLNEFGIGDSVGTGTLNFNHATSGLSSFAQSACTLPDRVVQLDRSVDVPVRTLDDYCLEKSIDRIDLVKIDTEGFELNVLRGGFGLFERQAVSVVIFEFGSHQVAQNHSFRDFYEFFTDYGYRMFQLGLGKQGWKRMMIDQYEERFEDFSDTWMFGACLPGINNDV